MQRPCSGSHTLSDTNALSRRPPGHPMPQQVLGENRFNGGSKVGEESLRGALDELHK